MNDRMISVESLSSYCYVTITDAGDNETVVIEDGEVSDHFPGWFTIPCRTPEGYTYFHLISDPIDRHIVRKNERVSPITLDGAVLSGPFLGVVGGNAFVGSMPGMRRMYEVTERGDWRPINLDDRRPIRVQEIDGKKHLLHLIDDGLACDEIDGGKLVTSDIDFLPQVVDAVFDDDQIKTLKKEGDSWSIEVIETEGSLIWGRELNEFTAKFGDPDWWRPLTSIEGGVAVGLGLDTILLFDNGDYEVMESCIHLSAIEEQSTPSHSCFSSLISDEEVSEATETAGKIGLVLTCHPPYATLLVDAMKSIDDAGVPDGAKVLMCDGFEPNEFDVNIPSGWRVHVGDWGSPNPARNIGVSMLDVDWVIFFDADNLMRPDYYRKIKMAASDVECDVGVIYPSVNFMNSSGHVWREQEAPGWDRWQLSKKNFIDSSSAWRRAAILGSGGWDEGTPSEDDYGLALSVVRAGWKGKPFDGVLDHNDHWERPGRWGQAFNKGLEDEALWRARSFQVISLMSGREELFERWGEWFHQAKLPPNSTLTLVDNSRNPDFTSRIRDFLSAMIVKGKFSSVEYVDYNDRILPEEALEDYFDAVKHQHVADMYGGLLASSEADFIFTFEDDVFPPDDALWKLHAPFVESFCSDDLTAVIGAAYGDPNDPEHLVTASVCEDDWGSGVLRWEQVSENSLRQVYFVGGGCTLWGNWALRGCIPFDSVVGNDGFKIEGWDHQLCDRLRSDGWRVMLAADVICDHEPRDYKRRKEF